MTANVRSIVLKPVDLIDFLLTRKCSFRLDRFLTLIQDISLDTTFCVTCTRPAIVPKYNALRDNCRQARFDRHISREGAHLALSASGELVDSQARAHRGAAH